MACMRRQIRNSVILAVLQFMAFWLVKGHESQRKRPSFEKQPSNRHKTGDGKPFSRKYLLILHTDYQQ